MKFVTALPLALIVAVPCHTFIVPRPLTPSLASRNTDVSYDTSLHAIGVLARKAKEMYVKKYMDSGDVEQAVTDKLKIVEEAALAGDDVAAAQHDRALQTALTKRKGTITVIAEYKRRLDKGSFIDEVYDPENLSPTFREFGASAVAVMADERMGGCSYADIVTMKTEQETARGDMPGPLPLISSDFIVHEIQLAQSAVAGAGAVVLQPAALGPERARALFRGAAVLGLEVIVAVNSAEEAQTAVSDLGATLLMVSVGSGAADAADLDLSPASRMAFFDELDVPEGTELCKIASITPRDDKGLQEVEDAWICRDQGFQAVWASEVLYKAGNDAVEHPGAIINSMRSKSSVKWASTKARGGKGEGAREYLGDILM